MNDQTQAADPINDAIAAAQNAAAQAAATPPAPAAGVPATVPNGQTAVAPAPAAAAPIGNSLDDFDTSGMDVEAFIKVTEFGLLIPKECDTPTKEKVRVMIDLGECVRHLAIKASKGKITKYWKTYDGITSVPDGKPWAQAIQEARMLSGKPDLDPYETVDIPMTLLQDAGTAKLGDVLGYSLSTTNKKDFKTFLRQIAKKGFPVGSGKVVVDISSKKMTSDSYVWGVVKFEFVEPYTEQ